MYENCNNCMKGNEGKEQVQALLLRMREKEEPHFIILRLREKMKYKLKSKESSFNNFFAY